MKKKLNSRAIACQVLLKVVRQGQAFHPQLILQVCPRTTDNAFIAHLCFGVLRFYHRLEGFAQRLIPKPLKAKDQDLHLLILIGLYQLYYTDNPSYAVLHSTVEAASVLNKAWAKKFINGVLRQALAKGKACFPKDPLEIVTAHPAWLAQKIQQAWPADWEKIMEANLTPGPLSLRVNARQGTVADYLPKLNTLAPKAKTLAFCPQGILLEEGVSVNDLPGFAQGALSVQDGAGQLAAGLLDLQPGQRVLDACAAPGSKTSHLLETQKDLAYLLAIDHDPHRVPLLADTLKRLNLSADIQCQDATEPEQWWDGQLFDRILVDAPCSATGVIRRHPDIKLHRQPQDIDVLVKKQTLLLEKLWPLLKVGGILIYATCSILPEENVERIIDFLQRHPDAVEKPIEASWGIAQAYGRQLLPGQHEMDGFYYARLQKILNA